MNLPDKVKCKNCCVSGNEMAGLQKPIALNLSLKSYFGLEFQLFVSYVYPSCL